MPKLGDASSPSTCRGWQLPYLILLQESIPAVGDRWGYYLRTLEAGKLLDEPIPQIGLGEPDKRVFGLLHEWSRLIGRDCGDWSNFRTLPDWICWGLAMCKEAPHLSDEINERLYHLALQRSGDVSTELVSYLRVDRLASN